MEPEKTDHSHRVTKKAPMHELGLLYEPTSEQEVVYLFSRYHQELGFPYILNFQERFPDVIVLDEDKNKIRIEIEVMASDFKNHDHDPDGCDIIICWENDASAFGENYPDIVSIKEYLSDEEKL